MRKPITVLAVCSCALLAGHAPAVEPETPEGSSLHDLASGSYLFTPSALSGTYVEDRLTLKGVPLVIYFSDRPDRISGHIGLERFASLWDLGDDSFKHDPPNAALAIDTPEGERQSVLILGKPVVDRTELSFDIELVEGEIPVSFGHSALFIDCLGIIEACDTNRN